MGKIMRELHSLYLVSELSTHNDLSIPEILEKAVNLIPKAYQYPLITGVRISCQNSTYSSVNFIETPWGQKAEILVDNIPTGTVELFYTEKYNDAKTENYYLIDDGEFINSIAHVLGSAINRIRVLSNLIESEQKFRSLVEQDHIGVYIHQVNSFVYVNHGFEKISGYSYSQLVPCMSFEDLIHDDDRNVFEKANSKEKYGNHKSCKQIVKMINRQGEIRYIELIYSNFKYRGCPAIIGTISDVTDRVEEEYRISMAVTEAQEKERIQIGMELHDNIKQILAISQLHIDIVKQFIKEQKDPYEVLNKTRSLIGNAISEIRKLSHQLIPIIDTIPDFNNVIKILVSNLSQEVCFNVTLDLNQEVADLIMKKDLINIYRIIQEQLNNILKHAEAKNVIISLGKSQNGFLLSVKDDGKGFDVSQIRSGIGLNNIKRRTMLLNGRMEIKTEPGNGCEVIILF